MLCQNDLISNVVLLLSPFQSSSCPVTALPHSNHMTSSKRVNTLIGHTTLLRNYINILYNPGHVTLSCLESSSGDLC